MNHIEQKVTHLQLIQDVIKRMADNSFKIKAWATALVSAIVAISEKADQFYLLPMAGFIIVLFWYLDAYFLRLENLYRDLYDHVRKLDDVAPLAFDLNPYMKNVEHKKPDGIFNYVFSITLNLFYGFLVLTIIVITTLAII